MSNHGNSLESETMGRIAGGQYYLTRECDRSEAKSACPHNSRGAPVNDTLGRGSLEGMKSELELVRRARQGDKDAFGQLVEHHWTRLVRLARSVVGEAEAEDAVQDGLIQTWRKLSQLTEPKAFRGWVSRIVVRVCLRRARSRRTNLVPLEVAPEPRSNPDPGTAMDVGRLLSSLAPRQRAVMHLTVIEGLTDSEIAPLLGITAASVRTHRHRARERLEKHRVRRSAA